MATTLMTPSRTFGNSVSAAQAPYSTMAPSMADTLPAIDFGFNDLRERMSQFTARFDDFIDRGRKRVLEERNAFRMNLAEISDAQRHRRQDIVEIESKSNVHASTLAKEAAETAEMHASIQALTLQKETNLTRRDQLRSQIDALTVQVKTRKDAQTAHQKSLDAQARLNAPELSFWEGVLCLKIEGTGVEDQLRFVFLGLDEKYGEREHFFELHMGETEYEVVTTKPRLNPEAVKAVQTHLNETDQLGPFIKAIRELFLRQTKS